MQAHNAIEHLFALYADIHEALYSKDDCRILDLVNKSFQQLWLFHAVNMLLYKVFKQSVLHCYG
jgi:hypothetical protein